MNKTIFVNETGVNEAGLILHFQTSLLLAGFQIK